MKSRVALSGLALLSGVVAIWFYSRGAVEPGAVEPTPSKKPRINVEDQTDVPAAKSVREQTETPSSSSKAVADVEGEATRLMSGRCLDDQGYTIDGQIRIEPLVGPGFRQAPIKDGFFKCELPAKLFQGEYAKVYISAKSRIAYAGPLRIAPDLVVPVRSLQSSTVSGSITILGPPLKEWTVKVFFKGSRTVIATPYPVTKFMTPKAEMRIMVFEPSSLDSDKDVVLMLFTGRVPILRVEYKDLRSLRAEIKKGVELRPITHRFNIPGLVQTVYIRPKDWEYSRDRQFLVENGYCEGVFSAGSYVVSAGSHAARVELTDEDDRGYTNVVWELSTETSDVDIAAALPDDKPLSEGFVVLYSELVTRRTRTGKDGRVTLKDVPAGDYSLVAQSKSTRYRARRRVTVPTEQVVIVLKERLILTLNLRAVVPELADATESGRIWYRRVGKLNWTAWRNLEAAFVPKFEVDEPGEYEIAVSTSANMVGSATASAPSSALINVQMELVEAVKGVIESKASVAGYTVALPRSDTTKLLPWEKCRVDQSGKFELLSKTTSPRLVVFDKGSRLRDSYVRTAQAGEEELRVVVK